MRTYVLANTKEQFADWCTRNRVNANGVTCVTNPDEIRGKMTCSDQLIDARLTRDNTIEGPKLVWFDSQPRLN